MPAGSEGPNEKEGRTLWNSEGKGIRSRGNPGGPIEGTVKPDRRRGAMNPVRRTINTKAWDERTCLRGFCRERTWWRRGNASKPTREAPEWTDCRLKRPPRDSRPSGPRSGRSSRTVNTGHKPCVAWRFLNRGEGYGNWELGIPTVVDRLIQQALLQVLQPLIDPTFSEFSFGFRPGRNAHGAVRTAKQYVQDGYQIVVDVDLEKFFDRVNHDILMDRLAKRIADKRILQLIRRYLQAGIMADGVTMERTDGIPQGGPLSPLLANVLLDEVDKELERRGHKFVRYADDSNVYVRSRRAGERVLQSLKRLYAKLHLKVNESKTAVGPAFGRKFLGYCFRRWSNNTVKIAVAPKALETFRHRIREITCRSGGRSLEQVAEQLRRYLPGWKSYFHLAQTPRTFKDLDSWIRHRLRAVQLKHWKRGRTVYREVLKIGASSELAAMAARRVQGW